LYLLDSDILIDIQRGHPPALAWFSSLSEVPSVPGLVVMELLQDANNLQQMHRVLKLVQPLPVVWPKEDDCNRALSHFVSYHLSQGLGLLDALIAACALGLSASLCTFNVKHYQHVPGLSTTQPYSR
jgi:hypothetical protein